MLHEGYDDPEDVSVDEVRPILKEYGTIPEMLPQEFHAECAFTFRVSQQRLDRTDTAPENVRLYRVEDGTPNSLETEHLGNDRFRAVAPGFSVFIIGTVPADISFTPAQLDRSSIGVGETITTTVQVQNDVGQAGNLTLVLQADGTDISRKTVSVPPEASTEVELGARFDERGTYDITVNGNAIGSLDVTDATSTPAGGPTETPGAEASDGDGQAGDGNGQAGDGQASDDVTADTPDGSGLPIGPVGILGALIAILIAAGLWVRHTSVGDDEQDPKQQDSPEDASPESNQQEGDQDLEDDRGQKEDSNE